MKLESKFIINGEVVDKVTSFNGIDIYEVSKETESYKCIYFVDEKGRVIQKLEVTADCSQNVGYIDTITFSVVN